VWARPLRNDLAVEFLIINERPWRSIVLHELSDGEAHLLYLLFPHLDGLDLDEVEDLGDRVRLVARTRTSSVACHGCGVLSARVHDRYRRRLQDLSCAGRPVQVELEVRRFICDNPACPMATFAEQALGLTAKHQRRTVGLRGLLERVALALAGRAGSRLARVLGAIVSRFTLIRLVKAMPDPEIGQVTVLGIDDWAKRRGQSYASVLVTWTITASSTCCPTERPAPSPTGCARTRASRSSAGTGPMPTRWEAGRVHPMPSRWQTGGMTWANT
jgi:transposase